MTAPIFLTQLSLRHFRNFTTLDVSLENEPGVLIVQGSNGLGKSSLFQGMEWLLTDQVEQFRLVDKNRPKASYLCRWEKPDSEPTSVSMSFSDDVTLRRELATPTTRVSKLFGKKDLASYLMAPDWQASIGDLGHYLLLTHFLSQSTLSRLSYREGGERFDILKDAAQSRLPELIAKALHGSGTTKPARAFKNLKDKADADAAAARLLLDHEESAWRDAQVAGALDEADSQQLGMLVLDLIRSVVPQIATADSEPDLRSLALSDRLTEAQRTLERRALHLARAREVLAERRPLQIELSVVKDVGRSIAERLEALPDEDQAAAKSAAQKNAQLAALNSKVSMQSLRLENLEELEDHHRALALTAAQAAKPGASEAAQERSAAEAQISVLLRRKQIAERLGAELSRLVLDAEQLTAQREAADHFEAAERRLSLLSSALETLQAAHPDLNAELDVVSADVEAASLVSETLYQSLSSLTEAADVISAAMAAIVANLPVDACDCPVCDTSFPTADALRTRTRAAADRLTPEIARRQSELAEARQQHQIYVEKRDTLKALGARLASAEAALVAERQDREALRRRAEAMGVMLTDDTAATSLSLGVALEQIHRRTSRRLRWKRAFEATDTDAALQDATKARDEALRTLDLVTRERDDGARRARWLTTEIERLSLGLFDDGEIGAEVREKARSDTIGTLAEARSAQERAQAELSAAEQEVTRLALERVELETRRESSISSLHELKLREASQVEEWRALGLPGDLSTGSAEALNEADRQLMTGRDILADAGARLARLREGRMAWKKQGAHRVALDGLRSHVRGPANHTRDQLRATVSAELRAQSTRSATITRTKAVASRASNAINAELNTFNEDYIQPLANLMLRINRTILCDPRIGVDFKVQGNAVNQAAVKGDLIPADRGDINPLLVHSEGQMAALGVSLLSAASLTFPWSRWKALVLDDPLQHNDAIHASAFADFIGNLILDRQYQVLMSTHELSQAEFLQRKFRARGIPCTMVNLLGAGETGVQQDIRGPDARSATA